MSRKHKHPSLRRPVTRERFLAEILRAMGHAVRAGAIPAVAGVVQFTRGLSRTHGANARRYAQVSSGCAGAAPVFEFAPEALLLPSAHRRGLVAHEVGHVIAHYALGPGHSETQADACARAVLGVAIGYDKRWPGKGLQVARASRVKGSRRR